MFSDKYKNLTVDLTATTYAGNLSSQRELLTSTRIAKGEMSATKGPFLLNSALTGDIDALDAIRLDVRLGPLFLLVQQH